MRPENPAVYILFKSTEKFCLASENNCENICLWISVDSPLREELEPIRIYPYFSAKGMNRRVIFAPLAVGSNINKRGYFFEES